MSLGIRQSKRIGDKLEYEYPYTQILSTKDMSTLKTNFMTKYITRGIPKPRP